MTPPTTAPTWGTGVRNLRRIHGISQARLAELAGTSQSTISSIEGGSRQISDAVRVRIARALEVAPYALFPYEEEEAS